MVPSRSGQIRTRLTDRIYFEAFRFMHCKSERVIGIADSDTLFSANLSVNEAAIAFEGVPN